MTLRRAIVAGVTAAAMLAAGGVLASAINDLPQDAVPVQDPTAALNRQAAPPTPSTPPPVEPAPEAAPAPSSPVAVTPAVPTIVIAEADEKAEEKEAQAAPAKRVEAPAAPARRQRRRVAIVEAIDKITAESMRFEVEVGGRPVRFQRTLIFTARACEVSAADEQVSDAVAYLEVSLQPRGVIQVNEPRQIFRGWMFASSPAISGLEHPIYDAWIVGCKA
ncbi:DUF2155 domain-containing protein [Brevundimonas sp.]|uniref:DUF2155 domain-containing protein n=1 Tax=Brevundimonas sp. TaxID=1871086 RepID=UPI00120C17E3|nr:DUF2155 domain-containing protein [Brevundimonas sp.]TAJ67760.1 MAG: DUF2155 domain-containing protein [Brevundimonas sp.]